MSPSTSPRAGARLVWVWDGKRVAVIGRYPGLEAYAGRFDLTVLERQPSDLDLPDAAAEYLLADADWVFMTATTLINKTFPRLADLAAAGFRVQGHEAHFFPKRFVPMGRFVPSVGHHVLDRAFGTMVYFRLTKD